MWPGRSDTGHNGRAETGRRCTESGCYPESREKQRQISRQITSFYKEPKESPRVDELERQVKELNEKLERERKGQDPLELMEKSYEMAARYFPGQTGGQVKNIQPAGAPVPAILPP